MSIRQEIDLYAYLIFDLSDRFLLERRVTDSRPRPLGQIRFFITATRDPNTNQPQPLRNPLELSIVTNRSGYSLFFGEIRRGSVRYRHHFLPPGSYQVQIEGNYYLPATVWVDLPASAAQLSGVNLDAPPDMATTSIPVDLEPGISYPFPSRSTRLYGTLIVRTAQQQTIRVPDALVTAVDANGRAVSTTWTTDARGDWLLILSNRLNANSVVVRFTLPGTGTVHSAQIELARYVENTFPPMIFIGE